MSLELKSEGNQGPGSEVKIRPKLKEAVLYSCYVCMGYLVDGRLDCEIPSCPLYHWMPYRKLEPDYSWVGKDRKRGGPVKKKKWKGREINEEQKAKMQAALKKYREKKRVEKERETERLLKLISPKEK